jgi:predicted RNA-binding Zn-ribbon protein involved in translation (DUF1610 family)
MERRHILRLVLTALNTPYLKVLKPLPPFHSASGLCIVARKYTEREIEYVEWRCPECGLAKAYQRLESRRGDAVQCDGEVILKANEREFWYCHDRDERTGIH